jgi:5S rRNA maturation endonuclease (ribonuclease M5)
LAKLDELIDNEAGAQLRGQLEEHMRGCEHCTVTVSTTLKTIEIYRSYEIYELPPALRERLHAAILARCRRGC